MEQPRRYQQPRGRQQPLPPGPGTERPPDRVKMVFLWSAPTFGISTLFAVLNSTNVPPILGAINGVSLVALVVSGSGLLWRRWGHHRSR